MVLDFQKQGPGLKVRSVSVQFGPVSGPHAVLRTGPLSTTKHHRKALEGSVVMGMDGQSDSYSLIPPVNNDGDGEFFFLTALLCPGEIVYRFSFKVVCLDLINYEFKKKKKDFPE